MAPTAAACLRRRRRRRPPDVAPSPDPAPASSSSIAPSPRRMVSHRGPKTRRATRSLLCHSGATARERERGYGASLTRRVDAAGVPTAAHSPHTTGRPAGRGPSARARRLCSLRCSGIRELGASLVRAQCRRRAQQHSAGATAHAGPVPRHTCSAHTQRPHAPLLQAMCSGPAPLPAASRAFTSAPNSSRRCTAGRFPRSHAVHSTGASLCVARAAPGTSSSSLCRKGA